MPTVTSRQAELLHLCILSCRLSLVPHSSWAIAYARAAGGNITVAHVEPDWLTFRCAWSREVAQAWERACNVHNDLHFLVFEGVNRSPSSAWAQPWLSIAAGLYEHLPSEEPLPWPDNLRVLITFDKSAGAFAPTADFSYLSGAITATPIGQTDVPPGHAADGYVEAQTWLQWSRRSGDAVVAAESFDDLDLGKAADPWYRAIRTGLISDC